MTTYVHSDSPGARAAPRALGRFLEIGPRPDRLGDDWTTVGLEENAYTDHIAIWGHHRLPFDEATFEGFYAAHVIEHIPWWNVVPALSEAYRVLKPGGWIELHTIDFEVLVRCYLERKAGDKWTCGGMNEGVDPIRWITSRLFCWGRTYHDPNWHRALFDGRYLAQCLAEAGFVDIEPAKAPRGPEKHGIVNVGRTARKPG